MSLPVLVWVLEHSEATHGRRLVLIALAEFAHDDGSKAFPSVETLMARTRMSRRGVQDALRRLEADGHIVPGAKTPAGTRIYRVVMRGAESARAESSTLGAQNSAKTTSHSAPNPTTDPTTNPSEREAPALEPDDVDRVLAILGRACRLKNCKLPGRDAIATVMEAYPDRDAQRVAHELLWWCEHGNGESTAVKNMAAKYRTFMRVADPAPPPLVSNGSGTPRSAYDRIEN